MASKDLERMMALMERMMAASAPVAPVINVHVNLAELAFGPKKKTDGPESNPEAPAPDQRQRQPYPSPS